MHKRRHESKFNFKVEGKFIVYLNTEYDVSILQKSAFIDFRAIVVLWYYICVPQKSWYKWPLTVGVYLRDMRQFGAW